MQVIKEATRTTAETNTLTYYTVTNKKDNVADSGIIPCGIVTITLFILSGMPGFLKLKGSKNCCSWKHQKLK